MRVIEDEDGNIYPVTRLFDSKGCEVDDLILAETFESRLDDNNWMQGDADSIHIHTVH